jgi:hypothetical protein
MSKLTEAERPKCSRCDNTELLVTTTRAKGWTSPEGIPTADHDVLVVFCSRCLAIQGVAGKS